MIPLSKVSTRTIDEVPTGNLFVLGVRDQRLLHLRLANNRAALHFSAPKTLYIEYSDNARCIDLGVQPVVYFDPLTLSFKDADEVAGAIAISSSKSILAEDRSGNLLYVDLTDFQVKNPESPRWYVRTWDLRVRSEDGQLHTLLQRTESLAVA